jgi:hypothetical protein
MEGEAGGAAGGVWPGFVVSFSVEAPALPSSVIYLTLGSPIQLLLTGHEALASTDGGKRPLRLLSSSIILAPPHAALVVLDL